MAGAVEAIEETRVVAQQDAETVTEMLALLVGNERQSLSGNMLNRMNRL